MAKGEECKIRVVVIKSSEIIHEIRSFVILESVELNHNIFITCWVFDTLISLNHLIRLIFEII